MRSIKVYYFNELSEEAKERAVDAIIRAGLNFTEIEVESITEVFKDEVIKYGFDEDVRVEWRLSYSQGDGVAFYGNLDFSRWLSNNKNLFSNEELDVLENDYIEVLVYPNSFGRLYSHYNTMDIKLNSNYLDEYTDLFDKIYDTINDDIKNLSKRLENLGYEMIDYYNSFEYVKELAIANEFEFFEDGTLFR